MDQTISFFSGFNANDLLFLAQAALRTLWISFLSITIGTLIGILAGWMIQEGNWIAKVILTAVMDVFRSIPLVIQLVLFYNFAPIIGLNLSAFASGTVVLSLYAAALVANVTIGGINSVHSSLRRASRSLGMTYLQDMIYVVLPVGGRAVFPSWVGVALGVMKDSALVSVLGYFELLKASQTLITRTQEPFLVLAIAGAFYFALSYPVSRYAQHLEKRWSV